MWILDNAVTYIIMNCPNDHTKQFHYSQRFCSCGVSNHYHDFFCWLQAIRKMTLWYAVIILATLWYCLSRQHKEATCSVIHKCPIAKEISQCGVALGAVQKLSHAILGLCWQRPFLCMRIIFSSLELPPLLFSQVSHAIGHPPSWGVR